MKTNICGDEMNIYYFGWASFEPNLRVKHKDDYNDDYNTDIKVI